jgi:hypothetical protein
MNTGSKPFAKLQIIETGSFAVTHKMHTVKKTNIANHSSCIEKITMLNNSKNRSFALGSSLWNKEVPG